VSFDLAVLAMSASADQEAAVAKAGRCWNPRRHAEGEVDERIAAFYGELRSRFPDDATARDDCPWMAMPLDIGIDHVIMHLSLSPRTTPVIEAIQELAARHKLVLYDPQSDDVYLPPG
jgi:hypothetical protein